MITREQFIEAAREEIGTPFHHQGRASKTGLDCIGLPLLSLVKCGMAIRTLFAYKRKPDGRLLGVLRSIPYLKEIDPGVVQDADILVFIEPRTGSPGHVAIKTDVGMLHARVESKVDEHEISEAWKDRICAAFSIMGVE